jgi:hypothetical protein
MLIVTRENCISTNLHRLKFREDVREAEMVNPQMRSTPSFVGEFTCEYRSSGTRGGSKDVSIHWTGPVAQIIKESMQSLACIRKLERPKNQETRSSVQSNTKTTPVIEIILGRRRRPRSIVQKIFSISKSVRGEIGAIADIVQTNRD